MHDAPAGRRLNAVVLAGDRTAADPVARAAGVPCKALAPVDGRAMVLRVLDALDQSGCIDRIVLCGPPRDALSLCPELARRIDGARVDWTASLESPSRSAAAGLALLPPDQPVLLTTADHALLSPAVVSAFVSASLDAGGDVAVGLVRHALVQAAFPGTRRTRLRFRDGDYCTCNLFSLLSPSGRALAGFWQRVEQERKKPWRVLAAVVGLPRAAAYVLGRLTLDGAVRAASRRLSLRVSAVELPYAEAGVDVDTPDDYRLAERALAGRS